MRNPNPFVASPTDPTLEAFGRRYPIELRHFDFGANSTRETHCFPATIYLDGEPVMKVSNDGNGGAHNYRPLHSQSNESFRTMLNESFKKAYESLDDRIRERYKSILEKGDHDLSFSLDYVITELVNERLCLEQMRKDMKSKVVFFDSNDSRIYFYKIKPTEENMRYIKSKTQKDAGIVWLNDLPEAEAFVHWRKATDSILKNSPKQNEEANHA